MNNNLNIVLKVVIYLLICTNAASFFMFAILMQDATSDNFYALLWSTVYPLMMTFILYNILQIKRKALYHLGIIQLANAVLNTLLTGKPILESIFISAGTCLIFAALLCLRKDGVSAWYLLLREGSALSKGQNSSTMIGEASVEDTADNLASQNSEDKDSISTEQVKEHIKETIIPKESERVVSKIIAINDEVKYTSHTDLPYKEDGSIDYENMTSVQQFAYTSKTESIEVALMDLNTDIKILEKSIGSIQKELKSLQSGNRAMLRDALRKEQEKLEELYELRRKYSSKKKKSRKYIPIIVGCLILLLFFIPFLVSMNTNRTSKVKSQNNKNIELKWSTDYTEEDELSFEDDLSSLYHNLLSNGYTLEDLGNEKVFRQKMSEEKNRKILYDYVVERGDFIIGDFVDYERRVLRTLDREWLYEKLSEIYDLPSYEEYYKEMDDEETRKVVYDAAIEEGLEVGTWNEFNEMFGR